MHNRFKIFNLLYLFIFISCNSPKNQLGVFKVLPTPQSFQIKGVSLLNSSDINNYYNPHNIKLPKGSSFFNEIKTVNNPKEAQLIIKINPKLKIKSEGYHLDIKDNKVILYSKDKAGIIYGFATLEQLIEDAEEQNVNLPKCSIKDYPLIGYRAIHLDLKHHRETLDYYYKLIDQLKKYKINGIIAEVEDKIKYIRRPSIASNDAISIEEWQNLSLYAINRNVSISPLVQGLGHASFILKHEKYINLRDEPSNDWAFDPLNPRSYDLQYDLYKDALEALPHGKYIHVGGDEVITSGRGSGMSAMNLQLKWLNKVCKFANDSGRIPIFWDDMPLKYAGVYHTMFKPNMSKNLVDSIWSKNEILLNKLLPLFPKKCIYMRWNYHTPNSYGNLKAIDWFQKNGLMVMGATAGQTRWVLMPQREGNLEQIKDFSLISIKNNLNGLLLTLWDDDSPHFELYKRGIIAFAENTWSGDKISKSELKQNYRRRQFSIKAANEEYAFIDQLELPVASWKNILLKGNKRNFLARMENPLMNGLIDLPDIDNPGIWSKKYENKLKEAKNMILISDSISLKIKKIKKLKIKNKYTIDIYESVNSLVSFTPQILLLLKHFDQSKNESQRSIAISKINDLEKKFYNLKSEFEDTYSRTRLINKPKNYILDQDHHHHLANQSINFDWQFLAELLIFKKINNEMIN